jgi:hypothetical protein
MTVDLTRLLSSGLHTGRANQTTIQLLGFRVAGVPQIKRGVYTVWTVLVYVHVYAVALATSRVRWDLRTHPAFLWGRKCGFKLISIKKALFQSL